MAGICSSKDLRIPGIGRETHKPGAGPLAEFEINAENLAARRAFIRLTAREAKIMSELIPWSRSVAPQLAKEFYDWQFAFPATLKFFEGFLPSAEGSAGRCYAKSSNARRPPSPNFS